MAYLYLFKDLYTVCFQKDLGQLTLLNVVQRHNRTFRHSAKRSPWKRKERAGFSKCIAEPISTLGK